MDGSRPTSLTGRDKPRTGSPEAKALVTKTLSHWKADTDLAAIRDDEGLKALAENERKAWRSLWSEVDRILKQAAP